MAEPGGRWNRDCQVPAELLSRRCHGSLDTITDSERRGLRPIGRTVHEVALWTGALLAGLLVLPGVRIFQGVGTAAADFPRIPHAIIAGHRLILVESVAWPPGRYTTTPQGRVLCDGVYTGQSAGPLIAATGHWQALLQAGHRVSAVVVVHPTAAGDLALPDATDPGPAWTGPEQAAPSIRAHLPRGQGTASARAIAALIEATQDPA